MILGNINIDMSEDLDQIMIGNTAKTLHIYQEIMEEHGLIILNIDKTRNIPNETHKH